MHQESLSLLLNLIEKKQRSKCPDTKIRIELLIPSGTAYLAVLEAINETLIKKGILEKELPKSVDEYRKVLRKYFAVHNGKLLKEFEILYDSLHIHGYYRGGIYNVHAVKDYLAAARDFINKITHPTQQ